jgi:hypothetical protein
LYIRVDHIKFSQDGYHETTTDRSAMAATTAREYRVSTAEVPKYEYDEDNET